MNAAAGASPSVGLGLGSRVLLGQDGPLLLRKAGISADKYAPEPPYGTHGLHAPVSCVLCVPEAQGSLPGGAHTVHIPAQGGAVLTAYRGTPGRDRRASAAHRLGSAPRRRDRVHGHRVRTAAQGRSHPHLEDRAVPPAAVLRPDPLRACGVHARRRTGRATRRQPPEHDDARLHRHAERPALTSWPPAPRACAAPLTLALTLTLTLLLLLLLLQALFNGEIDASTVKHRLDVLSEVRPPVCIAILAAYNFQWRYPPLLQVRLPVYITSFSIMNVDPLKQAPTSSN